MKAVWFEKNGAASEVLTYGEMPEPVAAGGEVLIKVHASGVNKADTKVRGGADGQSMPFQRIIPHQDGAGVIESVGADVDRARIGERVWIFEAQIGRPFGTAAEYVVVPERNAIRLPDATTYREGACLGIPAVTAHRCLFQDGSIRGQTVLITGAAGGVGYYAIQLAKWAGAQVIATVSPKDTSVARAAGADYVIDRGEGVVDRVKQIVGPKGGVDRIVEVAFGANLPASVELLRDNGTLSAYASDAEHNPSVDFYSLSRKNPTLHFVFVFAIPVEAHAVAAADIVRALEGKALKHRIGTHVPLQQTARAHEATEKSLGGRAVVDLDPS